MKNFPLRYRVCVHLSCIWMGLWLMKQENIDKATLCDFWNQIIKGHGCSDLFIETMSCKVKSLTCWSLRMGGHVQMCSTNHLTRGQLSSPPFHGSMCVCVKKPSWKCVPSLSYFTSVYLNNPQPRPKTLKTRNKLFFVWLHDPQSLWAQ